MFQFYCLIIILMIENIEDQSIEEIASVGKKFKKGRL